MWEEEVRLDEAYEDWVEEVGDEQAEAYERFLARGGEREDWSVPTLSFEL